MNLADEIRAQIEKNKGLKLAVGEINNHLSILEELLRRERDDVQKQVNEAYQRGLEDGKAQSERGCEGCRFEETICTACENCCNSHMNHWTAKDDEIKVGDERMKAKRVMHEDYAFLYWTCSKCNSLVLEHDNFCSNCGADFRRNEDGEEKNNDEN